MAFTVGDTVVYPHHGAARIEEVKVRTIGGNDREYLVLSVQEGIGGLRIEVPADACDLVGVREVTTGEGLDALYKVLAQPAEDDPANWSRRYKANVEKLASGDVVRVAEVVRDLTRRDQDRGISAGEKRLLLKARTVLVSELALSFGTATDVAEQRLTDALAGQAPV